MLNCYCYIQPSDIDALSPVVLSVMGVGVPPIGSDTKEHRYPVQDTTLKFKRADISSLTEVIMNPVKNQAVLMALARKARLHAFNEFNWEKGY
jgi:glycosyltransferase involved in cell wall biosynthesis